MSERFRRDDRNDRFDEGAWRAMTFAHAEAMRLDHGYLGTEHLLLGILADATSPPSRAVANLGLDLPPRNAPSSLHTIPAYSAP